MAGREARVPGRKRSVWFSGAQIEEMERRGLEPADVVARGLLAGEPAECPVDLRPAMELVSLLAAALANGGKVVYPDGTDALEGTVNTPEVLARIAGSTPDDDGHRQW